MKLSAFTAIIAALAFSTAFAQGSVRVQLDSCNARLGDANTELRRIRQEITTAQTELNECKRQAADAERLRTRVGELETKNRELGENAALVEQLRENLSTLAAQNTQLATELNNARGTAASGPTFRQPISGILTAKSVQNVSGNNVIVADFIFTNLGSRPITSFDAVLRFFFQERLIYEIALPNVRNQAANNAQIRRNESINFRAGLPVTDQNLVNAAVESVDLLIEVTRVQ